jgi:hypothetical protein
MGSDSQQGEYFDIHHTLFTDSGSLAAFYPVNTGDSFSEVKTAGVFS